MVLMSNYRCGGLLEEFVVVGGLLLMQALLGGYSILMSHILSAGLKPLMVVAFKFVVTFVIISPLAVALERTKWPKKLSITLMLKFVLIAIAGMTAFEVLLLMGLKKTSPAIASAMPNLAPGFIFIIACSLRFEKVSIRCPYSIAKIMGTLLCLTGAITMSFLQTPDQVSPASSVTTNGKSFLFFSKSGNDDWLTGCFYLFSAVILTSCSMVLQAAVMVEFPAPLSLCAVTSLIGAGVLAVVQLIMEGNLDAGFPDHGIEFGLYVLASGIVISICSAFQSWAVNKRGPVFVSMFNPISSVCAAILAVLILGQTINLASLSGMLILFVGLYLVLWAKKKERCKLQGDDNEVFEADDIEKPLLR